VKREDYTSWLLPIALVAAAVCFPVLLQRCDDANERMETCVVVCKDTAGNCVCE
jgi:hypothetical protein